MPFYPFLHNMPTSILLRPFVFFLTARKAKGSWQLPVKTHHATNACLYEICPLYHTHEYPLRITPPPTSRPSPHAAASNDNAAFRLALSLAGDRAGCLRTTIRLCIAAPFQISSMPCIHSPSKCIQDERIPADQWRRTIAAAQATGLRHFVVNGCWQDDWPRVLQLAQQFPGIVLPQLGLHPWWVARRSRDWLDRLRRLLLENPTAGLGECGLDRGPKALKNVTFEDQLEVFEAQLRLAEELQRPVTVHCVKAFGHVHGLLTKVKLTVPVVLHAWTGSAGMVEQFAKLPNVYFSLNGYLTKLQPGKALTMLRGLPADRCLLESDAPDGVPTLTDAWLEAVPELREALPWLAKLEGGLNTPEAVMCTLTLVAAATGRSKEEVADAAWKASRRIYCWFQEGVG
jgi:TatD DNase family protein